MAGFLDFLSPIVGGISSVVGLIQSGQARQQAQQQAQQALQSFGSAADQQYQNMLGNNSRTLMGAAGQGGTALTNLGSNMGAAMAGAGLYNSSATAGGLEQAQANENSSIANLAAQNTYNAGQFYDQSQQQLAQMALGEANTNLGYATQQQNASRQGMGNFLGSLASSDLLQGGGGGSSYDPAYTQQQLDANNIGAGDLFSTAQSMPPPAGQPAAFNTAYGGNGMLGGAPISGGGMGVLGGGPLSGGMSSIKSVTPPMGAQMQMMSTLGSQGQNALSTSGANYTRTALPQINGTLGQGANLPGNAGGIGNGGQGADGSNPFYQNPWGNVLNRYTNNQGGVLGGR